jgi:hypothetical protein
MINSKDAKNILNRIVVQKLALNTIHIQHTCEGVCQNLLKYMIVKVCKFRHCRLWANNVF